MDGYYAAAVRLQRRVLREGLRGLLLRGAAYYRPYPYAYGYPPPVYGNPYPYPYGAGASVFFGNPGFSFFLSF